MNTVLIKVFAVIIACFVHDYDCENNHALGLIIVFVFYVMSWMDNIRPQPIVTVIVRFIAVNLNAFNWFL